MEEELLRALLFKAAGSVVEDLGALLSFPTCIDYGRS
jgi:hypothetical protein